jgi:hypothetical protein
MTDHLFARATINGLTAATFVAALMALAPIGSASAGAYAPRYASNQSYSAASNRDVEADSDCGTLLAQPGYASGFTAQSCMGVTRGVASNVQSRHMY